VYNGKAAGRLAMDTLEVTGMVMTGSLNSVITDSSPGMAAYVTGQKGNNNQQGVFLESRDEGRHVAVANPARDATDRIPGFLVAGTIENGATPCHTGLTCEADTASQGHSNAGHTATDVPLSAIGPGAWQFTGVYENTDVFIKVLRAAAGTYASPP
jgi:alkaline phosphatase